jgi:hypothetical protein
LIARVCERTFIGRHDEGEDGRRDDGTVAAEPQRQPQQRPSDQSPRPQRHPTTEKKVESTRQIKKDREIRRKGLGQGEGGEVDRNLMFGCKMGLVLFLFWCSFLVLRERAMR